MKKVLLTAVLLLVATSAFAGLQGSKHDLASTGTNGAKGTSDQVCKYCHAPHNASTPKALWARANGGAPAALYTNAGSMTATQVNTIALGMAAQTATCLSCHNNTGTTTVAGENLAGITGTKVIAEAVTGLSNDHPVGILYDATLASADGGLVTPNGTNKVDAAGKIPLYGTGTIECATCHAVHGVGTIPMFLRTTVKGSQLCIMCHSK